MKRAIDLIPTSVTRPERCEDYRTSHYRNDTSTTDKRCVRSGRFLVDRKHYCKPHAGVKALEILMEIEENE